MTIKEMDFVRDRLSAAIIDLETAFEDASPFVPATESVRRAIKMMKTAMGTLDAAHELFVVRLAWRDGNRLVVKFVKHDW